MEEKAGLAKYRNVWGSLLGKTGWGDSLEWGRGI